MDHGEGLTDSAGTIREFGGTVVVRNINAWGTVPTGPVIDCCSPVGYQLLYERNATALERQHGIVGQRVYFSVLVSMAQRLGTLRPGRRECSR